MSLRIRSLRLYERRGIAKGREGGGLSEGVRAETRAERLDVDTRARVLRISIFGAGETYVLTRRD